MKTILIILFTAVLLNAQNLILFYDDAPYDSDAQALFSRMTEAPDVDQKDNINQTILDFKSNGLWTNANLIYFFAGHTEQASLLNWVIASYDATATNSPTWTQYEGFKGNDSNAYLETGWNGDDDGGGVFERDSCSVGVYVRDSSAAAFDVIFGCYDGADAIRVSLFHTGNKVSSRFNSNATINSSGTVSSPKGLTLLSRDISSNYDIYKNGSLFETISRSSSGLVDTTLWFLAENPTGLYAPYQIAFGWVGGKLTAAEADSLNDIVERYMDRLGKGVQ